MNSIVMNQEAKEDIGICMFLFFFGDSSDRTWTRGWSRDHNDHNLQHQYYAVLKKLNKSSKEAGTFSHKLPYILTSS